MNILVTGGAGYIGSHVAKALFRAGHHPVVYDNLSRGNRWAVQWGPLEYGDLLDESRLDQVFSKNQFDAVIHLAALAYVGESMSDAGQYFHNNVQGSLCLLRAMQRASVTKIIFSSTCAVYGMPSSIPITEDTPTSPCNPYGESKRIVEQLLQWFGLCHDFQWVALRYFNAAGCDPDGQIGELHDPEPHLIPSLLQALLSPGRSCPVFGTDYPTPDGTCIRDYIHVSDLAQAHLLSLNHLNRQGFSGPINLGTGQGYSVSQIVAAIEHHTGLVVPVVFKPRRPGDPPQLVASAQRGKEILNWAPSLSSLDQIISTAWAWSQKVNSPLFQADLQSLSQSLLAMNSSLESKPKLETEYSTQPPIRELMPRQ